MPGNFGVAQILRQCLPGGDAPHVIPIGESGVTKENLGNRVTVHSYYYDITSLKYKRYDDCILRHGLSIKQQTQRPPAKAGGFKVRLKSRFRLKPGLCG